MEKRTRNFSASPEDENFHSSLSRGPRVDKERINEVALRRRGTIQKETLHVSSLTFLSEEFWQVSSNSRLSAKTKERKKKEKSQRCRSIEAL